MAVLGVMLGAASSLNHILSPAYSTCGRAAQGSTALLGTEAGTVRMFSLADGSCELHLAGHNFPVTALDVCWSVCGAFDGPVAVSGAADGGARACALLPA